MSPLVTVGIAWGISLLATACLLPHTFGSWSETLTMMFAAFLMLVFGPYLLVVGLCDALPRFFNHPEIMVVELLANGAHPIHTR